jgi:hypothetical protein
MVRRNIRVRERAKRRTDWARQSGTTTLTTGTGTFTTSDLLATYKSDAGNTAGVTVARTHLSMSVTSDVTAGDVFYWGLYKGPVSNVGTELAGSPTPFTDPYADWAMWQEKTASLDVLTTSGYGHYWGPSNNTTFDIRSKRKVEQLQESWLLVIEAGAVANTIVVNWNTSTLLMLP